MTIQVNILGSTWTITEGTEKEYPALAEIDGYADTSTRQIVLDDLLNNTDPLAKQNMPEYRKTVLRHELIHAFLYESGLDGNTYQSDGWAANEEMVDWIAIQFPKIMKVFTELSLV